MNKLNKTIKVICALACILSIISCQRKESDIVPEEEIIVPDEGTKPAEPEVPEEPEIVPEKKKKSIW